jgi:hypothetical protein
VHRHCRYVEEEQADGDCRYVEEEQADGDCRYVEEEHPVDGGTAGMLKRSSQPTQADGGCAGMLKRSIQHTQADGGCAGMLKRSIQYTQEDGTARSCRCARIFLRSLYCAADGQFLESRPCFQ